MNLAYFGRPNKGVQSWALAKKYHFSASFLNYTGSLKRNWKFSICFLFQKGKQIKLQTTKRGNQIKCPTFFPDLLWKCALMRKKNFRKKWKFVYFSLLAYFFVKCAVARSFKAFFILTNISKHIFKKINTCIIKKQKIKKCHHK